MIRVCCLHSSGSIDYIHLLVCVCAAGTNQMTMISYFNVFLGFSAIKLGVWKKGD